GPRRAGRDRPDHADGAGRPAPAVRRRDRPARRPAADRLRVLLRGRRAVRAAPADTAAAFAMTLILRLALAAGGGGRGGAGIAAWWKVFDPARSYEAPNEYLPALGALHWGPHFFIDRFAETVPALPVHAAGHPPGILLTLYALGISSPGGMAALCIGVGALSVPLVYPVGRRLLDERRARVATLLLAFAPGALL